MPTRVTSFIFIAVLLLGLTVLANALAQPIPARAGSPAAKAGRAMPAAADRQATPRAYLPLVGRVAPPTPTPTATATPAPSRVLSPTCYWFPLGPSDRDNVACSPTNGLVIQRYNISFSMVACCGTDRARRYAIAVDASKTAGEGDYRIGFDVRSLSQGGGYLFGVNPDTRAFSLIRVDDEDWKGGVALIPWTFSDRILPGAGVNRLEVERHGPDIFLRINGQQVAAVRDATWLDQGIGWTLYARNYQAPGLEVRFERMRYTQWNDRARG